MIRPLALVLAVTVPLAACDGLKEAMTAHVDVAARAGAQELSVTRLAELLGNAEIPLRPDVAETVANIWVDYQLLGYAAAHGDSLNDPKLIDETMWSAYATSRINKFAEQVRQRWAAGIDTVNMQARYEKGDLIAARHILINAPPEGADSSASKAASIRAQVTDANFIQLAERHNTQGAGGPGGSLPVTPRGQFVKEFEDAVLALKPGQISPVVKSQFGYHIIRRSTYDEVKEEFDRAMRENARQLGDSIYLADLEQASKIEVKGNAPAAMKALAREPEEHADDRTAIATSTLGDFTVGRAAKWIASQPNPQGVRQQMMQAPDSLLPQFVKALVRQDVLLQKADSAKIELDTAEVNEVRRAFVSAIANTWSGLNVNPRALADSAKAMPDRERLAASRIDTYVERLLTSNGQYIPVPSALSTALRSKYESKVNRAGLERALERATKVRATADSVRAARTPPSAVPMPGQEPQQPATDTAAKKRP